MRDGGSLLIGIVVGALVLALGFLLWRGARRWWRAWRYGVPIDHSTLLVEYGRRMTGAPDRQALAQLLTAELPRVLQVERAALLLPEGHHLVAVDGNDLYLPVSHAAARWVASGGEAQSTSRGRLHELIRQGPADLDWTRVWAPLMRGVDLRGLWLLGQREGNFLYSPEDLSWLTAIGRQAAVVLDAIHYAEQERRAASEIRALYQQVVETREMERGRLSRELHDGVLQDLCAVTRDLKALEAQQGESEAPFADLVIRSGEAVSALRAICHDLRPPLLQHDLAVALKALVEELDVRSSAPVYLQVSAEELGLSDDVALAVFRITQEALRNAIRHADASEIAVRLTQYPDRLRLTVTDDGRGIAGGVEPARFVAQGHYGLAGMRERATMIGGKLDVQTAVDYGTVVILELPRV
ncbi:MAG: GAF domain-containing sensor histidine kinase [Anaerolineae bacterium]|nr:GAF domain-containing sensor histidine kinase [Anaerolineae bacterium]